MNLRTPLSLVAAATLSACAGLTPPPAADTLANLPVVTYPERPAAGDFVYKLPAGKPIDLRILADGSALSSSVDQKVSASLVRDIYLYKRWASADGHTWEAADKLVGVHLSIALPSYEKPGPGEVHLTVNRKDAP